MRSALLLVFSWMSVAVWGQQAAVSPFNGKVVTTDSSGNYTFMVSGHFYGDGTNLSGFPANTLLANLDMINGSQATMLVCLGDLFKDISNDLPKYRSSLFDKLEIPLFNSVGNHDLTGSVYQDHFGATFFYFQVGRDIHVVLDTEMDNGSISGQQLTLLNEIEAKVNSAGADNVFFYGHRTVFSDAYTELDGIFRDNTQSLVATNFEDKVLPILKRIAGKSNVFWFAGSLGTAPASFFYFPDETNHITYIATAIRALPRDAVLLVHVTNGEVDFETRSLTGESLENLPYYDVELWQTTTGEQPFNYKLIPYYLKLIVLHRYFWYGIAFAFALVLAVKWLRRRKKTGQA